MKQYHDLLQTVLDKGIKKEDRTGTGTRSIFGYQMRFDLEEGFPLVTTKKVYWKGVVEELLWFLRSSTNVNDLPKSVQQIWSPWADEDGELGPIYGKQWRSWGASTTTGLTYIVDQIDTVIKNIKNNPDSRRHIVSAWNVGELEDMALPPCHLLFQFYVANDRLSCQLYQRSADTFIGIPFNIASYALLTHMVAQVCGLGVGDFVHTIGDAHIYNNHVKQVKEQLSRVELDLPTIKLNPAIDNIDDFTYDDIELVDYNHHPAIKGKVSV